jgi:hypothetical protein
MNNDCGTEGVTSDSVGNIGITFEETQGAVVLNRLLNKTTKNIHSATNLSAPVIPSKRAASAAGLTRDSLDNESTVASKMPTPFSLATPIASVVEPAQPSQLLASSILSRSEYDNPESRKRWEIEKFDKVVTFVRKQLSSSQTDLDKILFEYLKYPACYDISFLQALAAEFEVDISEVSRKKRASHKEVVYDLVNKLISK